MSDPKASPDGKHLYSVGTWLDAGVIKRQVLRSADLGQRWCVLPTPESIAEVAPSRAKDGVLYARACPAKGATGRILRSEDNGATWAATATSTPGGTDTCGQAGVLTGPRLLETSVSDPRTLWLMSRGQLVVDGVTYDGTTIHASTDGGESWVAVPPPRPTFPEVYEEAGFLFATVESFVLDSRSPRRAIAASTGPSFTAPAKAEWFTTEDGGATWQPMAAPPEALSGQTRTPLVDADSNLYLAAGLDLFRSTDWGRTWSARGELPHPLLDVTTLGAPASGTLFAWHTDASAVLDLDDSVWRTTNGGASWQRVSVPAGADPVLAPAEGVMVSVGTTLWSTTTDGGATWKAGPVGVAPGSIASSLPGQYWAVDRSSQVRAPTRERALSPALRSFDDGKSWQVAGAASGELLLDGASDDVAFTQGYSWSLSRSEDRGATWEALAPPPGLIVETATCAAPSSCLYVLLSAEYEPERCFISKSADRGRTWSPPRTIPMAVCYAKNLAVSAEDGDHLWSPCGPALCESKDAGSSWITHPLAIPADQGVNGLVVLPDGTLLAAAPPTNDGTAKASVMRSADGGATWQTVLSGQGVLFASKAAPHTVWMVEYRETTGPRLLRSDDAGATWNVRQVLEGNGFDFWVSGLVDRPQGGFLAATTYGLITLE
jgi:hypothetical protein